MSTVTEGLVLPACLTKAVRKNQVCFVTTKQTVLYVFAEVVLLKLLRAVQKAGGCTSVICGAA